MIVPYKSIFYAKTEKNLVLHIFVSDTYNLYTRIDKESSLRHDLIEISKKDLENLIALNELDLHIPYIHSLLEQE